MVQNGLAQIRWNGSSVEVFAPQLNSYIAMDTTYNDTLKRRRLDHVVQNEAKHKPFPMYNANEQYLQLDAI